VSLPELHGRCADVGYCVCEGENGCVEDAAAGGGVKDRRPIPDVLNPSQVQPPRNNGVSTKPYAQCKTCGGDLFAGRQHTHIISKRSRPLFCDKCQDYYEGKPTEHLQEVHGYIVQEVDAQDVNHALFAAGGKSTTTKPPSECGYCRRGGRPCKRHGGESAKERSLRLLGEKQLKPHAATSPPADYMVDPKGVATPKAQGAPAKAIESIPQEPVPVDRRVDREHITLPPPTTATEIEITIGAVTIVVRGLKS
jgi:hypothetical protein